MSPKCEWTNMDATSSAYAEGEEVPQHEWCERMATSISCVPFVGNLTCDLHKCRCAKALDKARSVVDGPMSAIEILTRDRDEWKARAEAHLDGVLRASADLAALQAKVAMYNDADRVSFGEEICVEGCTVWDYTSGSKERNGGRTFTVYPSHDEAIAKAFELSKAGSK